ncbi:MAG: hypothetical protein PF508_00245 [Spirochaeta sp.]|jgi:hypothetical protein|nr:hypothetical protein [Spirochaeta sp.]
MKRAIPEFFLEQYRIGEASPEVVQLIESDTDALTRVAELDAESEELLRTYPPGWLADRVAERVPKKTRPAATIRHAVRGRGLFLTPVAALVVLGALLIPRLLTDGATPEELARGERLKGIESELFLYRSGEDGAIEPLSDGSTAQAGDRLQITYRAVGASHGVIFSVDGRGLVTLHYPETPYESPELTTDGEVALPYAYVLDDAPAFEQFYLATFPGPVDVMDLVSRVGADVGEYHRENGDVSVAVVDAAVERAVSELSGDGGLQALTVYKREGA